MEYWNFISTISSAIATIISIISLCITLHSRKSRKTLKIFATMDYGHGLLKNMKIYKALCISVINNDSIDAYIDCCMIEFYKKSPSKKKPLEKTFPLVALPKEDSDSTLIHPGERVIYRINCTRSLAQMMRKYEKEGKVNYYDKAYICITLANQEVIRIPTKHTFSSIICEFEKPVGDGLFETEDDE